MTKERLLQYFQRSCRDNDVNGLEFCLTNGVNVKALFTMAKVGRRISGLMLASSQGSSAVVTRLLQLPEIDASLLVDGFTAASFACFAGHTDCVQTPDTGRPWSGLEPGKYASPVLCNTWQTPRNSRYLSEAAKH